MLDGLPAPVVVYVRWNSRNVEVPMPVKVLIMPSAERDMRSLDRVAARRVAAKLRAVQTAGRVGGDVKRLTGQPPRFRLRVGDYRVLFTVGSDTIRVYRIVHRREAYDR